MHGCLGKIVSIDPFESEEEKDIKLFANVVYKHLAVDNYGDFFKRDHESGAVIFDGFEVEEKLGKFFMLRYPKMLRILDLGESVGMAHERLQDHQNGLNTLKTIPNQKV